jgi:polysaccharide transporter, PST family
MIKKTKLFFADKNKRRLIDNILSLGILQIVNYVLPLVVLPYLVIVLGVEKFGVLAFALAVINYFNILIEYGFNLSATREISILREDKDKVSQIFSSVITIKLILFIISLSILSIFIYFFERLNNEMYVYYFTFLMLFGKTIFPVWYFQGVERMRYITFLNILPKLLATISIFIFIQEADDYVFVPLINSLGFVIGGLIAFIIAIKEVNLKIPSFNHMKTIFNESTSLFVSNLSVTFFTASNVLILGLFTTDYIVGIYSSIERLISALKNLIMPIYQGIFPWLSKKSSKDITKNIKHMFKYITIIFTLVSTFVFYFSQELLSIIYNNNESINQYFIVMQILSVISLISALNMLFNYLYLNAIKAYNLRMKLFLIAGVFNIITGVILTFYYKIYGISISFVLTELLLLILGFYYFKKTSNLKGNT